MNTVDVNESLQNITSFFHSRMEDFEKALHQHTVMAIPGSQLQTVKALSADYQQFKTFVVNAVRTLKMQLDLLNTSFDQLETHSRRKVLLLHGLPEDSKENVAAKVHEVLSSKMKLMQARPEDIEACHRLGTAKKERTRPVLVRFATYKSKSDVWKAKTMLKGSRISMSEFLTKSRQNIFVAARKHFGIKNCWSSDGTIVVMLPDKTKRKITEFGALQKLQDSFPATTNS